MAHAVETHRGAGAGVVGPKALVTIGDFVATGVTLVVVGGVLIAAGKYRAGFPAISCLGASP